MKSRFWIAAATLIMALACGGMTPEERAAWEKEQKEKEAKIDQDLQNLAATLAQIDQQLQAHPGFSEVTCEPAKVKALLGKDTGGLNHNKPSSLRRELLPEFANGPFKGKKELPKHLGWMNSEWLVKAQQPQDGREGWQVSSDKEWITERLADHASVLVVYVPIEEAEAKVAKKDGIFTDGVYDMGFFDGWFTLWNLQNGEFLCSTFFSGESSSSVSFDDKGLMKTTFEEAVEKDFNEQVQNKATEARQRLTSDLKLGYQLFEL